MSHAANYSAVETLRNGRRVEIRALRPDDRDEYVAAVSHSGPQSLYRRFFGAKRHFTEEEIRFFVNVDFVDHVALVAVAEEDDHPAIVGGGRYVVSAPGKGELAFIGGGQISGPGHWRGSDASSQLDCPRGWATRTYCRGIAKQ